MSSLEPEAGHCISRQAPSLVSAPVSSLLRVQRISHHARACPVSPPRMTSGTNAATHLGGRVGGWPHSHVVGLHSLGRLLVGGRVQSVQPGWGATLLRESPYQPRQQYGIWNVRPSFGC